MVKKRKQPHADLLRKTVKAVQDEWPEAWTYRPHPGGARYPSGNFVSTRSGVPDLFVIVDGTFFGLEAKVGRDKVRDNQQAELDAIGAAGGHPMVFRSVTDATNFIKEVLNDG